MKETKNVSGCDISKCWWHRIQEGELTVEPNEVVINKSYAVKKKTSSTAAAYVGSNSNYEVLFENEAASRSLTEVVLKKEEWGYSYNKNLVEYGQKIEVIALKGKNLPVLPDDIVKKIIEYLFVGILREMVPFAKDTKEREVLTNALFLNKAKISFSKKALNELKKAIKFVPPIPIRVIEGYSSYIDGRDVYSRTEFVIEIYYISKDDGKPKIIPIHPDIPKSHLSNFINAFEKIASGEPLNESESYNYSLAHTLYSAKETLFYEIYDELKHLRQIIADSMGLPNWDTKWEIEERYIEILFALHDRAYTTSDQTTPYRRLFRKGGLWYQAVSVIPTANKRTRKIYRKIKKWLTEDAIHPAEYLIEFADILAMTPEQKIRDIAEDEMERNAV